MMHRSLMARAAKIVMSVKPPLPAQAATALAVTYLDKKPQSWVTNCPHCERVIGITLEGNKT